jgi:3',5'-cyclic AMP phosphodiesterase CpdA
MSSASRLLLALVGTALACSAAEPFRFAIFGDRTGSTQPGVHEQVWTTAAANHPAFVLSTGDLIEGLQDATAEAEWQDWAKMMVAWKSIPFHTAPGNHDIWSAASAALFEKFTGKPRHYGFDSGPVHVTVLDNSGGDNLSVSEFNFMVDDLKAHADAPVKIIVSHRPFWLFSVMIDGGEFPLQQVAKKYGVKYVIAGHVHALLHSTVDGIEYVSMPSAGGHLRASSKYEDGWFFGYGWVEVADGKSSFKIRAVDGTNVRETTLEDWGMTGLKPASKP